MATVGGSEGSRRPGEARGTSAFADAVAVAVAVAAAVAGSEPLGEGWSSPDAKLQVCTNALPYDISMKRSRTCMRMEVTHGKFNPRVGNR